MNTTAHTLGRRQSGQLRSRMRGVTLLELMAVVMVIGVLGMIAIPSYRQYVMRAQRADAKTALLQLQTNQERYYLANRTYGTIAQLTAANLSNSGISERGAYQITLTGVSATGYTATAAPRAGGAFDMSGDAQCTTFSIDAQGVRTATGSAADTCW
ncbi:MAG TPA: type IV pilin protein [Gammaproteobacteria bacterium]|nr:type IV pilin protein [Gammaproteobacteria bacterium]